MIIKFIFSVLIFSTVINLSVLQLFSTKLHVPFSNEFIDTGFFLHTREEPNIYKNYRVSAYNLTSLRNSPFDPSKKTKFITHGFLNNGDAQWLKDLAAALLQNGDYNVLRVDWGRGSRTLPDQALANTKTVGEEIANFVNTLKREFNFNTADGHCIGHSMGGYVCGYAGQGVDKLGRITALDIAPIQITEVENDEILDPSDADFVDAIHTGFSLLNVLPSIAVQHPVAHIDINVNDGHYQTGCHIHLDSLLDVTNNLEEGLLDLVTNEAACGHLRPITYYIESILNPSCQWVAYECSSAELFDKGECASCGADSSKCGFLGPRADEYSDKTRERVVLFIDTAADAPYCVQHYVVSISTGIIIPNKSPSGGIITFEIIGSTGWFTEEFKIKKSDHGNITKKTFISHVDVGKISSVKITWKSGTSLLGLGLINLNSHYTLGINYIKVSPLNHYPESVRSSYEVVACLPSEGLSTPVQNRETKTFSVMTNC